MTRHAVQLRMRHWMTRIDSSAVLSPDRAYRYRLVRTWDYTRSALAVVGLSGSAANEQRDDPTVRRCVRLARDLGYGGLLLVNLYGRRTTRPAELWCYADPVGPGNDAELATVVCTHDLTVLAWGADAQPDRASAVAAMLWRGCREHGTSLAVLGWTCNEQPRHVLDVPAATLPECLTATLGAGGLGRHEIDDPRWGRLIGAGHDGLSAPRLRQSL